MLRGRPWLVLNLRGFDSAPVLVRENLGSRPFIASRIDVRSFLGNGDTLRMKIHQITHLFYPDQLAGAALYTDLARYLRDRGHDVRVTTTFSYYPALRYGPEDRGLLSRDEVFEGIRIRRVGMMLPQKHSGWRRLIPEISFLAALTLRGRFRNWTPDVIITACPMLAQVTWQRWAYLLTDIPRLVVVQDSMAHAATELGIIQARGLGQALHAFERWSLRAATRISTISPGMQERVDSITQGRIPSSVVPNWIHSSLADCIDERRSEARARAPHRLFYSGNFGVKQGLPAFLDALHGVRGDWEIALHGGGAEAETLARKVAGWGSWLTVGGLQAEADYIDALLGATACVVTQMPGVGANFLPSKLLPALATGTPVLAFCEPASPLGREVVEGGFGVVIRPGDTAMLKTVLERWAFGSAELASLSAHARERAERYSRQSSCATYERLLRGLVGQRRSNLR